jgi:phosphoglycolate phosphatase-like HAD superfamily hydrolase
MARLTIAGIVRDIDLVLFDKDGTLIDFHRIWGSRTQAAIRAVLTRTGPDSRLEDDLYRTLGFDRALGRVLAETPVAVASIPAIVIVAATVLHQHGHLWHAAETLARTTIAPALQATPEPGEIRPVGDVLGLMAGLRAARIQIGIVTTDDRAGTLATVAAEGWTPHLVGIACGDDPVPAKPRPDGLLALCRAAGVSPERTIMVGDSAGDMAAGRAAGCALVVGVTSGTGGRADLAPHADVVIDSVMDIRIG